MGKPTTNAQRKATGDAAERIVEKVLISRSIPYQCCSLERLVPKATTFALAQAIEHYHRAECHEVAGHLKRLRYLPDFRIMTPDNSYSYIDAKASRFIERECLAHYLTLEASGTPVYLALVLPDRPHVITLCRVTTLALVGEWTAHAGGSGTACKLIDLANTPQREITLG